MAVADTNSLSSTAQGFVNLNWQRQIGLLIGLAVSIALGFYVVLWSQKPDLVPLYAQLDSKDTAQLLDALQKMNVVHRFENNSGAILVAAQSVAEIRMKLAAQGLPKSTNIGFELLDQSQSFGTSQFMESVRYRRSLEGELARTISSLEGVRNARVHLGLPKESSFLKRQSGASASVVVELANGAPLNQAQVLGIVNLVSASVPGMSRDAVTVVDQSGKLLTNGANSAIAAAMDQFNYSRQLESVYSKRIQDLLTPLLGDNSVRAEVNADLDFTSNEESQERFNPKTTAIRSESTIEEDRHGVAGAEGIPGALSNQPPALASSPQQVTGTGPNGTSIVPESSRKQAVRNFDVDKSISYSKKDLGQVKRLSVAVVVNDKLSYDPKGKEIRTPLTPAELDRINNLVKDAIGFNATRGDSVSVMNVSFAQEAPITPMAPLKIYEQAWFIPAVKQGVAALFLLIVVFMVLRPMLKSLSVSSQTTKITEQKVLEEAMTAQQATKLPSIDNGQESLSRIKQMAQQDSKRVAQVVMNWVGSEDE